ncbi:MAG: NAD-binding protein [Thermoplasmata archaeon]|nr:NAD-binding protein [Thermoplasmata archaeon]
MTDTIRRRIRFFLVLLGLVVSIGVTGYFLIKVKIEGHDGTLLELIVDAIYWNTITLTTLGYYPPGVALTSVVGKFFTVVVVVMGVVLIVIAFPLALSPWFESRLKEIMTTKRIPVPSANHVIVCGYSEVGREVVDDLRNRGVEFLVIEDNQSLVRDLVSEGVPSVIGDPTKESVLERANLGRAIGLIAVEEDSENAFITLTANRLRPDLRIVGSIQNLSNASILRRAGAMQVLAPKSTVGALLAREAVGRRRGDLELPGQVLGDLTSGHFHVTHSSNVVGKRLSGIGLSSLQLMVVGVWRQGIFNVDPERWTLADGDVILLLGTAAQLEFVSGIFRGAP